MFPLSCATTATFLSCTIVLIPRLGLPYCCPEPRPQITPSIPFYSSGSESPPIRWQDGEEYDSGLALVGGEGVEQLSHPLTTAVRCEMSEYERHNLPFQFYLFLYISLPAFRASARFYPLSAFLKQTPHL